MQGKTVVITGGGQGIGRVLTRDLLKADHRVAVFEIDREAGSEMTSFEKRSSLLVLETDVSDEAQVKSAIGKTIEKFGSIDVLINNAAINIIKPVDQLSLEEWDQVIRTNLTGVFLCVKYAIPFLKKARGSVINLCSTRAFMSEPDTEAYSASKGGIFALTHALAISLGPEVRVNAISPGWIDVTPYQKLSGSKKAELSEEDHSQHPAGRVGKPEDISSLVTFLVNGENDFITGQNFIIDGGMTRKMIYE
jgi:NAD(P)-dependent dehydrogenase (short-subunit alcohol dehydrogenase family)